VARGVLVGGRDAATTKAAVRADGACGVGAALRRFSSAVNLLFREVSRASIL